MLWPRKRWHEDEAEEGATLKPTLDVEFDSGYGTAHGPPFTAWSEHWVYFPVVYDGAEWVASVPRNPCEEATDHVGGQ